MKGASDLAGKRVVFVFGSLDLGGAERRGLLLAQYLHKIGAHIEVVGFSATPGRLSVLCDEIGLRWKGVPFHWGLKRRLPSFLRAVMAVRGTAPDIVLSYTRVPNLVCAWGRKGIGAKLFIWNQADEGLLLNGTLPYRIAAAMPDCFISNSTAGGEFLVKTYGRARQDVHLVRNGVALAAAKSTRAQWRDQLGIEDNRPVVCMVANLSIYKDHETLLRAWSRVASASWEIAPLLLLAGRCDGTESNLMRLAQELSISDSVRLLGPVDDVAGLLAASDLFAYSSKSEGVPNGVLEAMSIGLPVIGTDIPGIREAVGPEGAEYLAPVGDHLGMAELITRMLLHKALRDELGGALKLRIEREFTLDRMCRKSAEIIGDAFIACAARR